MIVDCENKDCLNWHDGRCLCLAISIDMDGGCNSFIARHRCGECAKFGTTKCHVDFYALIDKTDAASHKCFEQKEE